MKLTPPAVRFVRCYDPNERRMVNLWMSLNTQEQIDDAPMATELTVQGKTVEECMVEIRKWKDTWKMEVEVIRKIEEASHSLIPAKPSFYGTLEEFKHA